jgi:hypothetical protein
MLIGDIYIEVEGTIPMRKDTRITISFSEAENTQFVFKGKDQLVLYE